MLQFHGKKLMNLVSFLLGSPLCVFDEITPKLPRNVPFS